MGYVCECPYKYSKRNVCVCVCVCLRACVCSASPISNTLSSSAANSCYGCSEASGVTIEGPLRRKTLLKEGRKPKVRGCLAFSGLSCFTEELVRCCQHVLVFAVLQLSSWTRYWISLSGSTLTFYGAKALRASERKHVSLMLKVQ